MAKGTSNRRHEKVVVPGILYAVQSTEPVDIFEMMITDEPVEYITTQTNLYFKQNISSMISKSISDVMGNLNNFDSELCNSVNICLYITSLLYCDIIHKPIAYMYYTWPIRHCLFKAPGFKSTLPQNKLVLIWK